MVAQSRRFLVRALRSPPQQSPVWLYDICCYAGYPTLPHAFNVVSKFQKKTRTCVRDSRNTLLVLQSNVSEIRINVIRSSLRFGLGGCGACSVAATCRSSSSIYFSSLPSFF
jgi:hypothetical protein